MDSVSDMTSLPITHQAVIPADYRDGMGHMNVMWYTHLFARAMGGVFRLVGLDREYFQQNQAGVFALKQLFSYRVEVHVGDEITIRSRVLGRSERRMHIVQFMFKGKDVLAATAETVSAHIDMRVRRTSPFPPHIAEAIDRLVVLHAALGAEPGSSGLLNP
ncbi:MAG: thioesterase family protein [Planctomycetaceae bacterium]